MSGEKTHATERAAIDDAIGHGAKLMNWPPSRGPMPESMRTKTTIRWRKPTIEVVPDDAKRLKPTRAKDRDQRSIDLAVWCQVSDVARVKVQHAISLISGAESRRWKGSTRVHATTMLPARTYVVDIAYPLSHAARVTIHPYKKIMTSGGKTRTIELCDVGYLLAMIARAYKRIYREHEKYGVWGHAMSDLGFEGLRIRDNIVEVDIGS